MQDMLKYGMIQLQYVATDNQLADAVKKALTAEMVTVAARQLGLPLEATKARH